MQRSWEGERCAFLRGTLPDLDFCGGPWWPYWMLVNLLKYINWINMHLGPCSRGTWVVRNRTTCTGLIQNRHIGGNVFLYCYVLSTPCTPHIGYYFLRLLRNLNVAVHSLSCSTQSYRWLRGRESAQRFHSHSSNEGCMLSCLSYFSCELWLVSAQWY